MNDGSPTVVIGAGIAGLAAARALLHDRNDVIVIDKGRGVGGRMASRRIGDATFDHGAQFFTVRGDDFRATVTAASADGVVDVWCRGFASDDGYPRYYCPKGMTGLAKWLANEVLELGGSIELGARVAGVGADGPGWLLEIDDADDIRATDLILTAPVPQSIALLDAGATSTPGDLDELRSMPYKSAFAVLAVLDGPSAVPEPGGVQQTEEDLFTFVSDNAVKGVSARPAVTLHTNGAFTAARWDDDRAAVLEELLAAARPWFGGSAVIESQLHAWRYAAPLRPRPEPYTIVARDPGVLMLAGEAFGGPKVEGSFNSGLAAARALTGQKNGLT